MHDPPLVEGPRSIVISKPNILVFSLWEVHEYDALFPIPNFLWKAYVRWGRDKSTDEDIVKVEYTTRDKNFSR